MKLLTRWRWSAQRKQNLALIALLAYYLAWFLVPLMYHQFFVSLASDYLALWSAGKIAREQGFAQVTAWKRSATSSKRWCPILTHNNWCFTRFQPLICPFSSFRCYSCPAFRQR
jgi:hypothetical protein